MKRLVLLMIFSAVVLSQQTQNLSYDYKEMSEEQYAVEFKKWQDREAAAKKSNDETLAEIEKMKGLLAQYNTDTENAWKEVYALSGNDGNGTNETFNSYMDEVNQLRKDVQAFMGLSSEEAYKRRNELDAFQKRLDALNMNASSNLTEAQNVLNSIQSMIEQGRSKATLPNSMYEVQKGDYLWKIAGKSDIYGDPYAWVRIYNSNKDQIKDPNLIFTSQVFTIARTVEANQYLVNRGDNLFKIANQYGNVFSWMKLYEMNKSIIEDQNLIYPYQVITVPNN